MKCKNCGEVLIEGANFCQNCGAAVVRPAVESAPAPGKAASSDIHIDVGHNEGQVIGQVNASGNQPVHIGGQQHFGDVVQGDKVDMHGGDLVFGNKIDGDFIQGDKIGGDKIMVSGAGSQVQVSHGLDAAELAALFQEVSRQIDRLPERVEIDKDELKDTAGRLEKELAKGDQANPERLKRWLDVLEKYAPDVVEILVNALLNPGAGAASAVKAALKQFGRQPPDR